MPEYCNMKRSEIISITSIRQKQNRTEMGKKKKKGSGKCNNRLKDITDDNTWNKTRKKRKKETTEM